MLASNSSIFTLNFKLDKALGRIQHLHTTIRSYTEGPAPDVSQEESLEIQELILEIQQLQTVVRQTLKLLVAKATVDILNC